MKYGDRVKHKITGDIGTFQGNSIEHKGWVVVRWDNILEPNPGYCYYPSELEVIKEK